MTVPTPEVRDKLEKLQAEADAGLKTSASYTVAKAVDDWAAEALDRLADKFDPEAPYERRLPPWSEVIDALPVRAGAA